jgi:NosR/NirI family nitrous oxide reductase transcriptional regulator
MRNKAQIFMLIVVISLLTFNLLAIQRFPKPEFENGYQVPSTQVSKVQPLFFEFLDIAVFAGCMVLITWVILKKRSRRLVFWISIFSLLYFGFYRKGCICPVGSVQNITMAIFNPAYNVPLTAIIFFIIPVGFTLYFGRTFCAGVCPLGAIQDLFALRPVSLKPSTRSLLGLIPFLYLGLAILFAATGSDFIICRYDPFVGFFRHNATYLMFAIGGVLLLTGIFIARPYCRFFCPYGIILNLVSRVSRRHLTIPNGSCINCKLCDNACPFDAIDKPTGLDIKDRKRDLVRKLMIYGFITPALIILTGWTVSKYHEDFANVNFKVRLAREIMTTDTNADPATIPTEVTTFRSSDTPAETLYKEAELIIGRFNIGSWILGGFIGLVLGLTLARLTIYRYRNEYSANRGHCFSCARCIDYCPVR